MSVVSAKMDAITRRFIGVLLWPTLATVFGALLLAATLPKLSLPWLALPALACLLWSWKRRIWYESAALGFLAGMIYFSFAYRWFGETAGSVVGWFAPGLVLGPALLSAWTFSAAALAQWLGQKYARPAFLAPATAAAFTVFEMCRSIGPLANPFASIAYPQVDTIFGALAPFIGATGITFALVYTAALLEEMIVKPTRLRTPGIALGVIAMLLILAHFGSPARTLSPAVTPIAIVQGNIRQELKWVPGALDGAVNRYVGLTSGIRANGPTAADRPRFVVWPETVIPTDLAAAPALQEQFRQLAGDLGTTLIIGALERRNNIPYNTLWFVDQTGIERVYRKRELVPFAETLPGASFLSWIPLTQYISHFGRGTENSVVPIDEHRIAPLICWETEFPALLAPQVHDGADVFVDSTDDAWFGATDGPYQHAQIAQMRALETGRYVVRAAATGISGIIAPNGRYTQRSVLNTVTVVRGFIGNAVDTPFNHLGAYTMYFALIVLYCGIVALGYRARPRNVS